MARQRKIGTNFWSVAALAWPVLLAACGGGPPPPMVMNSDAGPQPIHTGVTVCGQQVQMQVAASGTWAGSNAAGGGKAQPGAIVMDDAGNYWGMSGNWGIGYGTLIGPATKMPDGNWQVTPQPGATPSVGIPCPPPGGRPMDTTPSGNAG
ncbi:MAG: hypothetical protein KGI46_10130 [Alphaproteobacteria bacterium]|nr:hypothetical protein [Alphaproteobacteria bacterium]MDE1931682.1 hypothetical protein [Alphaproteobacteria bacterium]